MDAGLIFISVSIVFFILRNEYLYPGIPVSKWLIPTIILIGLPFYIFSNQYKRLTRFSSTMILYQIAVRNFFITFIFYLINIVFINNRIQFLNLILIWFLARSLM